LNDLARQFREIDKDNSGSLSSDEILSAYRKLKGADFSENEVKEMIKKADVDGNGEISYDEWILTAINV
jgi:calcium-binding protein CML